MPKRVPRNVVIDDVPQLGSRSSQRVAIAGGVEVAVEGVEEPERRVGGVVEAFLSAFGEHVGDQAVADVVGEGAEDVAGFVRAGRSASVSPSRLIMVSRPQSVNQW